MMPLEVSLKTGFNEVEMSSYNHDLSVIVSFRD